mmetsp:Transcript_22826/g.33848  ORF Transcript_22826/g.33848 Transcript_22826/m.33848 type:complete len:95 (-) Transcript_22826:169-453(-)
MSPGLLVWREYNKNASMGIGCLECNLASKRLWSNRARNIVIQQGIGGEPSFREGIDPQFDKRKPNIVATCLRASNVLRLEQCEQEVVPAMMRGA